MNTPRIEFDGFRSGQRGDREEQRERGPGQHAERERAVPGITFLEPVQHVAKVGMQQHNRADEYEFRRQPRPFEAVRENHRHSERDRDGRRGCHHGFVQDAPEVCVRGLVATDEHTRQEQQAGKPSRDRRDVKKFQPKNHSTLSAVLLLIAPAPVYAHTLSSADAWLLVPWLTIAAFYAFGIGRLGVRAVAFAAGWLALGAALLSPLDAYAEASLAAHMTQHMLLLAVVPPLLVAGRLAAVLLGIMPTSMARLLARIARWRGWPNGLGAATVLQLLVVWGWHAPLAVVWASRSDALHWAMHASFLIAGLLFWTALWRSARGGVAIAVTMAHMGLLAALMTFSPRSWYSVYPELADQQLAGLIMWVPAAVPYIIGGLAIAAAWLRRGKLATEHTSASHDS